MSKPGIPAFRAVAPGCLPAGHVCMYRVCMYTHLLAALALGRRGPRSTCRANRLQESPSSTTAQCLLVPASHRTSLPPYRWEACLDVARMTSAVWACPEKSMPYRHACRESVAHSIITQDSPARTLRRRGHRRPCPCPCSCPLVPNPRTSLAQPASLIQPGLADQSMQAFRLGNACQALPARDCRNTPSRSADAPTCAAAQGSGRSASWRGCAR